MSNLVPELLHIVGAIALRPHGVSRLNGAPFEARALWFAALLLAVDIIGEGWSRHRNTRGSRLPRERPVVEPDALHQRRKSRVGTNGVEEALGQRLAREE